jgi:hypothetical protein
VTVAQMWQLPNRNVGPKALKPDRPIPTSKNGNAASDSIALRVLTRTERCEI